MKRNFRLSILMCLWALVVILAAAPPARAGGDDITGVWKQFVVLNGKEVWLLTCHITKVAGMYETNVLQMSETIKRSGADVTKTYNHRYNGTTWDFDSDWHQQGIAHFVLKKVASNRFQGWSYLKGRPYNRNIWVRISK